LIKAAISPVVPDTSGRVRLLAITILIGALALVVPDRALASVYTWSATGGGTWATPSNWTLVSGPLRAGYPNQPGDVAQFESSNDNRTITINQTIFLFRLVINSSGNVSLFGNSNGRLVFDDATTTSGESFVEAIGTGAHVIGVPILLTETLRMVVDNPAGRLACTAGTGQTGGAQRLDKSGPGTLHFTSLQNNTYLGLTSVRDGVLELQHFGGAIAVAGDLAVGSGTLNPPTAIVRLRNDEQIVSERSMYWPGDAAPFGEGHNSAGMVVTATHWGLAEGRIGGPQQFQTYILLANPGSSAAEVTITFLREGGAAPIVKTYKVPGTSRFNVDVAAVPELQNESFGARIDVTNGIDIAVERSLYWSANGVFWAGGTNALATPVP
jgi:autotransporter-associated beta strand protein